jgi:hypothetical protein
MLIFTIGLPRTGNGSLAEALRILGLRVHQYSPVPGDDWPDGLIAEGYDAFVDHPCGVRAIELRDRYPEAQFILTVREDVDAWYASLCRHLGNILSSADAPRIDEAIAVHQQIFGGQALPPSAAACALRARWNAERINAIPAARLLALDPTRPTPYTWRELCAFLRLQPPWPHRNRTQPNPAPFAFPNEE